MAFVCTVCIEVCGGVAGASWPLCVQSVVKCVSMNMCMCVFFYVHTVPLESNDCVPRARTEYTYEYTCE